MATADSTTQNSLDSSISPENGPVNDLTNSLEKATLQPQELVTGPNGENHDPPRRPLYVYPRSQLLYLSKSALVQTPDEMPSLKDWFGDWHEQQLSSKKDAEPSSTATNARDRRFRRDADDGDPPARPAFRTTLSQPSQMGNFRHQPIRTADRDKEKDTDKERDIRDKEGAERLRNLSDKYDRDRLALSAVSTLRNKERDSAPHLNAGSSARLGQAQGANGTRRGEPTKRKAGENEDWRRGAEPSRAGRDDRPEASRRERDNRERPRSRSRPRRDPSATRRERDRDREDKPRDRRTDDRDEHRRDRDDHPRRERDDYFRRDWDDRLRDRDDSYREGRGGRDYGDRESDEDPRRWRDDGKREERLAARRERGWDRWEPGNDKDRVDDRDGRPKRTTGRDRRPGGTTEEGKDRDDRREKEKEPAWMETYVPSSPGAGILGGQSVEGELDGIQAWKKGLKEKERKEKELEDPPEVSKKSPDHTTKSSAPGGPESGMDEIQLFKLMMKREAEKKESENGTTDTSLSGVSTPRPTGVSSGPIDNKHVQSPSPNDEAVDVTPADPVSSNEPAQSEANNVSTATTGGPHNLLSLISSGTSDGHSPSPSVSKQFHEIVGDVVQPAVSRFFPTPPGLSSSASQSMDRAPIDLTGTAQTTPFNPPQGSRLLAFASRNPAAGSLSAAGGPLKAPGSLDSPVNVHPTALPPGTSIPNVSRLPNVPSSAGGVGMGLHQGSDASPNLGSEFQFAGNARVTPSESPFAVRSYSPFGQPSQGSYVYDDMQDSRFSQGSDAIRRGSIHPSSAQFGPSSEAGSPYPDLNNNAPNGPGNGSVYDMSGNPVGANYASGKGSRFAKFFDTKSRESQAGSGVRRSSAGAGFVSTSPHPGQRQDPMGLNGLTANNDNRTMEDIFAMLQNSSQNHRLSPQIGQPNRGPSGGGGAFGQSHAELQAMQLQQLQQQQFAHNNRLDSLYDSRLDDRNFVPDGMVPGLRPAPRPRSREPSGVLFNEHIDDPVQFNVQRLPQQQRNLEHMYSGPTTPLYNQHPSQQALARNAGIQLQQAQFRGGPSPIQGSLQTPTHRLPPGLANLGGRPPHDPAQYMGSPMGVPNVHGGVAPNAPAQQGFGNFGGGGNLGFAGNPQARGPIPGPHHQNPLALNQMAGPGPNNNLDLRGPNQAQFIGMGGGGTGLGGLGGNLRGANGGFNPQHGPGAQMQGPHLAALRQQQHLPLHLVQQMLPPHLQPQQGIPGSNTQGAQDLMALLMGNHRD